LEEKVEALRGLKRDKKMVLVIIPFAGVGSGKTTLMRSLQKLCQESLGWEFKYVSSDECKKEVMEKLL